MTTQSITLLRHGQVDGEAALYGHTDVRLSDIGRINLHAALDNIHGKLPIDAIVSSPLVRCAEISSAFADKRAINYRLDARFKEMHFGDWDGVAFDKLNHVWHDLEVFFNSPHAVHPPAGETLSQFAQRIISAWEHLLENNQHRHLVLVCHGGVIRVIIAHLLSIDWGNANLFKQLQIDYASHSRIEVQKDFLPLIKYIGSH